MASLITTGVLQVIVFAQCFYSSFSTTFSQPTRGNVALHKSCSMTSNFGSDYYNGADEMFINGCEAAVNNDTRTTYKPGNCIHSEFTDIHPRWTVFLGQNYRIEEIVVYMRAGFNERRRNISLFIDDARVFHEDGDAGGTIRVPSQPGKLNKTGRSVTVARDGQSGDYNTFLLNVCEVQVWVAVCPEGNYPNGDQCLPCGHCAHNAFCNNSTGHCPNGCESGYEQTSTCHTKNVALNKRCNMSSTYTRAGFNNSCETAINGDTRTLYQLGNCIHTALGDVQPRWTVDLGQKYPIQRIVVYFRERSTLRTSNVFIFIDNNKVFHNPGESGEILNVSLPTGPTTTGQYVTVARDGNSSNLNTYLLNICEVQVWASIICPDGSYFKDGQCLSCGHCANGRSCSYLGGDCPNGCEAGYNQSPLCQTACDPYHYGTDCQQTCSAGCGGNGTCDKMTGVCNVLPCKPGYMHTDNCSRPCDPYYFGTDCQQTCSAGCGGNGTCDKVTGVCNVLPCKTGHRHTDNCSEPCDPHHYGDGCQQTCSSGCGGDGECDKVNGTCTSLPCKPGYRQSAKCDQFCSLGTFGSNCSGNCGAGCVTNGNCDSVDGTCTCINDNWARGKCSECAPGHYGPASNCQNRCGNGCKDGTCNPDNGHCSCKKGWQPPLCADCADGFYGNDCALSCGHCADNIPCDKTNGHCPTQCDGSFQPPLCQALYETPSNTKDIIGPIVGSVVGVGALISLSVIILAIAKWKRRSRNEPHQNKTVSDDSSPRVSETGFDITASPPRPSPVACTDRPATNRKGPKDSSEVYVEMDSVELQQETTGSAQGGHTAQYYNVAETSSDHYDKLASPYQNIDEVVQPYEKMQVP